MSANLANGFTHTVGFYNGERWPIQLVISKFNITLTLKAGEYVLDRAGRKINDPYFELFVTNKQLRREESDVAVALITVPIVTVATPLTSPQTNPVRSVNWTRDSRGVRQPVLTQPEPPPPQQLPDAVVATATDSVRPMTMDEARKAGYVRRVREVPEDYGVTDTTGLPPGNIPRMRVAIDPSMNKPATPLPKGMLNMPANDPNRQVRSQIVAGLAQSAKAPPADTSSSPFGNAGIVNNSPLMAGKPVPIQESAPAELEPEFASEPEPEPELQVELGEQPVVALPEPDLQELQEMEAQEPPPPAPVAPRLTQPKPPLKPLTPANKLTCIACGAGFKFRSQLVSHAKLKHPDLVNAIVGQYPETPAST